MDINPIIVRNACPSDFPTLAAMEEAVWGPEGVERLNENHFKAWQQCYPEGFFVARNTNDSAIIGFASIEEVNFKLEATLPQKFLNFNRLTNHGLIIEAHEPGGSHHFGVTICSQQRGGAFQLLRTIIDHCKQRKQPLLGASRMSKLTDYMLTATEQGVEADMSALALHYAVSCVIMAGGRIHPSLLEGYQPDRLPPVTTIDPVLKSYLRHPEFVFYRLLPGFLHDRNSHDFAVLFGQEDCI